jgi:ribonuclease HI
VAKLFDIAPKPQSTLPLVHLFTDGACVPNPGVGGWAYILRDAKTCWERHGWGAVAKATNNQMELTSVLEGLSALKTPSSVTIVSDSQYVVKGGGEWMHGWHRKQWAGVKNPEMWRRLWTFSLTHSLTFQWVKGHNGHPENERCDQLAMRALNTKQFEPQSAYVPPQKAQAPT